MKDRFANGDNMNLLKQILDKWQEITQEQLVPGHILYDNLVVPITQILEPYVSAVEEFKKQLQPTLLSNELRPEIAQVICNWLKINIPETMIKIQPVNALCYVKQPIQAIIPKGTKWTDGQITWQNTEDINLEQARPVSEKNQPELLYYVPTKVIYQPTQKNIARSSGTNLYLGEWKTEPVWQWIQTNVIHIRLAEEVIPNVRGITWDWIRDQWLQNWQKFALGTISDNNSTTNSASP